MVATFPYIFLDFLPSRMFKRHVSIIGVSWKITLTDGVHIVNYGPLPLQKIYIYIYLYRLPVEVEKFLLVYMLIPILLSFYLPFFFFFFLVSRKSCSSFSRSFKFFEVVLVRWTSWLSNLSYADSSVHKKVLGM